MENIKEAGGCLIDSLTMRPSVRYMGPLASMYLTKQSSA